MSATARIWNETDIPAVASAALSAALSLWLERERAGLVLVGAAPVATIETIEADVIGLHEHPADGLAVLLRMRSLIEVLSARRFRHLVRAENAATLYRLVEIASTARLNPRWGMSPVRLGWALATTAPAVETRRAA